MAADDGALFEERTVRYWGWTDSNREWFGGEVDVTPALPELVEAPLKSRLVEIPATGRGLLGEAFPEVIDDADVLVLNRLEPSAAIKILRGDVTELIELEDRDRVMFPSWFKFHPGNVVSQLSGPGGPGKVELERWINGMDWFGDQRVTLTPILSVADYEMLQRARRINAITVRMSPEQPIAVDSGVLADVGRVLRDRLGDVSFNLTVRAQKDRDGVYDEEADQLRNEIGRIVQTAPDQWSSAKVEADGIGAQRTRSLVESQVTARVGIELLGRNTLTNRNCADALDAAYIEAQDELTPAIAEGDEGGHV